ncbi:MAG: FmdB family zinc ribbon protein [Fimbriimonadaceae bacterium]
MPVYEYEPLDHDCVICPGRVEVLQGVHDEPCKFCPICGLPVKRAVSRASFELKRTMNPEKASARGFTTYKRAQKGAYEKVAGEGPEAFTSPKETTVRKPTKIVDLD